MANALKKVTETHIKGQIKDYLALRGIFSAPLLQGMGSYRGLPDRLLHLNGEVVYLEIKKPDGKMSEYQLKFQSQCESDGITYWVVESVEELEQRIREKTQGTV